MLAHLIFLEHIINFHLHFKMELFFMLHFHINIYNNLFYFKV